MIGTTISGISYQLQYKNISTVAILGYVIRSCQIQMLAAINLEEHTTTKHFQLKLINNFYLIPWV